jgi:hypothetical protein
MFKHNKFHYLALTALLAINSYSAKASQELDQFDYKPSCLQRLIRAFVPCIGIADEEINPPKKTTTKEGPMDPALYNFLEGYRVSGIPITPYLPFGALPIVYENEYYTIAEVDPTSHYVKMQSSSSSPPIICLLDVNQVSGWRPAYGKWSKTN